MLVLTLMSTDAETGTFGQSDPDHLLGHAGPGRDLELTRARG